MRPSIQNEPYPSLLDQKSFVVKGMMVLRDSGAGREAKHLRDGARTLVYRGPRNRIGTGLRAGRCVCDANADGRLYRRSGNRSRSRGRRARQGYCASSGCRQQKRESESSLREDHGNCPVESWPRYKGGDGPAEKWRMRQFLRQRQRENRLIRATCTAPRLPRRYASS